MPPSSALVFPASESGFIAQFPIRYECTRLGPRNHFADGSQLISSVESRRRSRWTLRYSHLSNTERDRFEEFLHFAEGKGQSFRFFDPLGNLLAHSEDLEAAVWSRTGALDVAPFTDPDLGAAFVVTNTSLDWRALNQTISFGHAFRACGSVAVKWASPVPFRLSISDSSGTTAKTFSVAAPQRVYLSRLASSLETATTFSLELPPNSQVILARPQFEIGAQPAAYSPTASQSGVYEAAYLRQDRYRWVSPAPDSHQITLSVEGIR
jgi:hypothetical protein